MARFRNTLFAGTAVLCVGTASSFIAGCGTILGLDEYNVEDGTGGESGGSGGSDGSMCDEDCDDGNPCTTDSCIASECAHVTVEAGESCSGGVCNGVSGAAACVRCIDDAPGEDQDSGCPSTAPSCDTTGTPTCGGCESHEDCDDGNDCTEDTCTSDSKCETETEPAGTTCAEGICNGIADAEACEPCLDDETGTSTDSGCTSEAPFCSETGGSCDECLDDQTGMTQDTGCDGATPLCNNGVCVECISDGHCDDEIECTDNACSDGECVNTANDSLCGYNGTSGECQTCNESTGCEDSGAPTEGAELLENPAFDLGIVGWTESSTCCPDIGLIVTYASIGAQAPPEHSTDRVAWLGGWDDEISVLSQKGISLPDGTVGLKLAVNLFQETTEADDEDQAWATIRAVDEINSVEVFRWYSDDTLWTLHEETVDIHDWNASTVDLEFTADIPAYNNGNPVNPNHSSFFLDTLSLKPLICQ